MEFRGQKGKGKNILSISRIFRLKETNENAILPMHVFRKATVCCWVTTAHNNLLSRPKSLVLMHAIIILSNKFIILT